VVDHAPSFDASLPQATRRPLPLTESAGARTLLIAIALGFLLLFLLLPLIGLIPYAKNARTHTDAQVAASTSSASRSNGWPNPPL
jgi:hypothetical protein